MTRKPSTCGDASAASDPAACSFCGRRDVRVVAGSKAAICAGCVRLCADIVETWAIQVTGPSSDVPPDAGTKGRP